MFRICFVLLWSGVDLTETDSFVNPLEKLHYRPEKLVLFVGLGAIEAVGTYLRRQSEPTKYQQLVRHNVMCAFFGRICAIYKYDLTSWY